MKKKISFILSLIIFILIAILVTNDMTNDFDNYIYNLITFSKSDLITNIFKIITFFASEYGILLVTIICFIIIKDKKYCSCIFLSAFFVVLLNYLLKMIFMRERPIELMIIEETGYSFPSGHAMLSLSFYGFIIYVIRKLNLKYKNIFTILFSILIILIGSSRIYLGVHYPSDVCAGFFISLSFLVMYITIIERINKND